MTVGSKKFVPRSTRGCPPQRTRAPQLTASSTRSTMRWTWSGRIMGPTSVVGSLPGPSRSFFVFATQPAANSSLTDCSTKRRSTERQTWPQFVKLPQTAALAAMSRSASPSTSIASFRSEFVAHGLLDEETLYREADLAAICEAAPNGGACGDVEVCISKHQHRVFQIGIRRSRIARRRDALQRGRLGRNL